MSEAIRFRPEMKSLLLAIVQMVCETFSFPPFATGCLSRSRMEKGLSFNNDEDRCGVTRPGPSGSLSAAMSDWKDSTKVPGCDQITPFRIGSPSICAEKIDPDAVAGASTQQDRVQNG